MKWLLSETIQAVASTRVIVQRYARTIPKLVGKIVHYAHTRQYQRMRSHLNNLKTLVGRVWRDVSRQLAKVPQHLKPKVAGLLQKGLVVGVRRAVCQVNPYDEHTCTWLWSGWCPDTVVAEGSIRRLGLSRCNRSSRD